jgi:hypothetical protein
MVTGVGGLDGGGMMKIGVVGSLGALRVVSPHAVRFDATAPTKNGVQFTYTSQRTTADRDRPARCPAAQSRRVRGLSPSYTRSHRVVLQQE